jgi:hypothetical protein
VLAIWIVDAHRDDGRRFIVHADEKLSAFVELERQVLTVTFYLESTRARVRDSLPYGAWEPASFRRCCLRRSLFAQNILAEE